MHLLRILPVRFVVSSRAVSDDLEVMVKENQVVSGQLVTVGGDRENAHKEIQNLHARLANAEQTINIKETGIEDIRHAYEVCPGKP